MKLFFLLAVISFSTACMADAKKVLPVSKEMEAAKKEQQAKAPAKKEADCDEKAKKPIEITPTSLSLSGNTGCSLDEAKP